MITRIGSMFALLLLAFVGPAAALEPAKLSSMLEQLEAWQTDEVREQMDRLLARDEPDEGTRFVLARLLFYEGRYADAARTLATLSEDFDEVPRGYLEAVRADITKTAKALEGFDEVVSEDGRFLIHYKGRDKLLVPWMLDVLKATDDALSKDFGYRPTGRVVVDIYPETKFLSAVSTLTVEEIETSGTIALCKYNRLMFTSPRALVRGYGWRDTVAHEFVHYYVTKKSANTVPIWLHEGIAKFQESRWRAPPGPALEPPQEDLLARSLKTDTLVTFDQMHPSMAKLPSQEAAALAFAEVHTVIDFLHRKAGYDGINKLLVRLRDGDEMDEALQRSYGFDLDGLWKVWKAQLSTRGFKTYPGLVQTSLKFKRPGQENGEEPEGPKGDDADIDTIKDKRVRDFTHLGELLRARSRHGAALKEYRKAEGIGGDGNPLLQNGIATTLLTLERAAEVPATLERVRSYYPTFLTTFVNLGEAWLALGKQAEATAAFEEALGINPFHPRVHAALLALYEAAGRNDDAARVKAALEILK